MSERCNGLPTICIEELAADPAKLTKAHILEIIGLFGEVPFSVLEKIVTAQHQSSGEASRLDYGKHNSLEGLVRGMANEQLVKKTGTNGELTLGLTLLGGRLRTFLPQGISQALWLGNPVNPQS